MRPLLLALALAEAPLAFALNLLGECSGWLLDREMEQMELLRGDVPLKLRAIWAAEHVIWPLQSAISKTWCGVHRTARKMFPEEP